MIHKSVMSLISLDKAEEDPERRHWLLSANALLLLITSLTAIFGALLFGLGLNLFILTRQVDSVALSQALLGGVITLTSLAGAIGAKKEKDGLLKLFFYTSLCLMAALVFVITVSFAFQSAMEIYIKHHWNDAAFDWFRSSDCCKTYPELLSHVKRIGFILGATSSFVLFLLLCAAALTIRILTVPIVMRDMLTLINILLILVGSGLALCGFYWKGKRAVDPDHGWIGILLFVEGGILCVAALIGIIGSKAKSRGLLLMYIIAVILVGLFLVTCGVAAFVFSRTLASKYSDQELAGKIACAADLYQCSNCSTPAIGCTGVTRDERGQWTSCMWPHGANKTCSHPGSTVIPSLNSSELLLAPCGQCPEWPAGDIETYIHDKLGVLGLFCFMVNVFLVVGLGGALVLRRSLAGYQTDSI